MTTEAKKSECCPQINLSLWENRMLDWNDKRFVKEKVFTLFYMPLNFGSVMKRIMKRLEESGATSQEMLCLSDHTSKWNMDIYIDVDKEVKGAENVVLKGKYFSKVYEGDFKNTEKWCDDYKRYIKEKGMAVKKWFMWYTTCPKCAKKYGKNYVAIICEVGQM
jgi:effector-binding domain-containing protein